MSKGRVFAESYGDSREQQGYILSTLFSNQELSILFDNTHVLQNITLALNFICGHS